MLKFREVVRGIQERAAAVYRAEPTRLQRDFKTAQSRIQDHAGRWLWELLQNCDDAGASKVLIYVSEESQVCFVADNGSGFSPNSVESIRGTDLSDKKQGTTIGRKGVGFKSVYNITESPKILRVGGEGVEFDPKKCSEWLLQQQLPNEYNPYHWVPFLVEWNEVCRAAPSVQLLEGEYNTVVVLPYKDGCVHTKVVGELVELSPYFLLTFRNVKQIQVIGDAELLLRVHTLREWGSSVDKVVVDDGVEKHFRVMERKIEGADIPSKHLEGLDDDSRNFIIKGGISLLVASLLVNDEVQPFDEYPFLHVFYPTTQRSPVPLLIHAEFLVKSDRTALLPLSKTPLNDWIADKLSELVLEFVNAAYSVRRPSHYLTLLRPDPRMSDADTKQIWELVYQKAQSRLKLPDQCGELRLSIPEAIFISSSTTLREHARAIVAGTPIANQLIHASVDEDEQATETLRSLGVTEFTDEDIVECIADYGERKAGDHRWLKHCWEWLNEWLLRANYWGRLEREERLRQIPILPIAGAVRAFRDTEAEGLVIALPPQEKEDLPEWLPLALIERDFMVYLSEPNCREKVEQVLSALKLVEMGEQHLITALRKSISKYWEKEKESPYRFLNFILGWAQTRGWRTTLSALQDCPVPAYEASDPNKTPVPIKARWVYFGSEWGNPDLEAFYANTENVYFLCCLKGTLLDELDKLLDRQHLQHLLQQIGVKACPVVCVEEASVEDVLRSEDYSQGWRSYVRDQCEHSTREPKVQIKTLDEIDISSLDSEKQKLLMLIVFANWSQYYQEASTSKYEWFYYDKRSKYIESCWWYEFKHFLYPPLRGGYWRNKRVPLSKCWLPDRETRQLLGELLPVIDLEQLCDSKTQNEIADWLVKVVGVRTSYEDLSPDEWVEILSKRIPQLFTAENISRSEEKGRFIWRCYSAFLDWAKRNEQEADKAMPRMRDCRLLCKRGDEYDYESPRECSVYLDDAPRLSKHFEGAIWLLHLPSEYADEAHKYFGVASIRDKLVKEVCFEQSEQLSEEKEELIRRCLGYVYAERKKEARSGAERYLSLLRELKWYCASNIQVKLKLDNAERLVPTEWVYEEDENEKRIYLREAAQKHVAHAVAEALGVPSKAYFYEVLLRAETDEERRERLYEIGLNKADVDQALEEWNPVTQPDGQNDDERTPSHDKVDTGELDSETPDSTQPLEEPGHQPRGKEQPRPSKKPESDEPKEEIDLVNPDECAYELNLASSQRTPHNTSSIRQEGGSTSDLTNEERRKIEECGRELVKRVLRDSGFERISDMGERDPYDIVAFKDDVEYHIEVKAHAKSGSTIVLTVREFLEYVNQENYRWQLWNVEFLDKQSNRLPLISVYEDISAEAMEAQSFRVRLAECSPLRSLSKDNPSSD